MRKSLGEIKNKKVSENRAINGDLVIFGVNRK